jgi:hypothetical protein
VLLHQFKDVRKGVFFMYGKFFAFFFIVIALLVAIFASVLPQEKLTSIVYISRFFDVMIPILAVGALVKYIFHCHKWTCLKSESKEGASERPLNK